MQLAPRITGVTALVAISAALSAAAPAAAGHVIAVQGSLVPTSATFSTPRPVGSDVVIGFTGTHQWSGSLIGTSTISGFLVQHQSGTADFLAFGTFSGITPCGRATMRFVTWGGGQLPTLTGRAIGIGTGDDSIRANLHVDLVLGPTGAFVNYSGEVRCDD
jgi:hypothetical protein